MSQINQFSGVVEGFYWQTEWNGQVGYYSIDQRLQLIQMLSDNGLGLYWFIPQNTDTISLLNSTQVDDWTKTMTLANSLGIKVIYGIRPGYLDDETTSFQKILNKTKQLASIGVKYYSLGYDDAEGVDTTAQQQREVDLVNYLKQNLASSTIQLWAITPAYYTEELSDNNMSQWASDLSVIDGVDSSIPFVLTGSVYTPSTMTTAQFPTLASGRSFVFWDNWIAVDTLDRLPWGLIDGRVQASIFSTGYVLNLCYPLERAVHQIYCEGVVAANPTATCNVSAVAQYWSKFLNDNGFIHYSNETVNSVASTLQSAIEDDPYTLTSIPSLENQYPGIIGIFSQPPTQKSSSSSSPSTTSSSQVPDKDISSSSTLIVKTSGLLLLLLITLFI